MPKTKKSTTRDEAGVIEAEEALDSEIASMMTPHPSERTREDAELLFESKDTGNNNTVNEFDEVRQDDHVEGEQVEEEVEETEPTVREEEPQGETQDAEAEEEEQADELTEIERLREQNALFMKHLDGGAQMPPLPADPANEMADQTKPDETPIDAPTFQDIDGAAILSDVTDEQLYDAQNDIAAMRILLETAVGRGAAAAVQTSKLGTRDEIESYNRAERIVVDFMSLDHNKDLEPLQNTVVQRGAAIQERNRDISPTDALEMAGDQVREHYKMAPVTKSDKKTGPKTVKRVRGAGNGVTPAQPKFAGKTGARRTGGSSDKDTRSEFDKDVDEIHAAGQRGGFGYNR